MIDRTIDDVIDAEFENHLRITLDEMISKLVATTMAADDEHRVEAHQVVMLPSGPPALRPRRMIASLLAIAATLLGLIVIARRDDVPAVPASPSTVSPEIPDWYPSIHAALPERFSAIALTLALEQQRWFVAISPTDGKTLEIQLAIGASRVNPVTTVDATGTWWETPEGWSVLTPAGLQVEVRCGIGAADRDRAAPRNYCDLAETGAFTKTDVRAVASALAISLSPSTFDTPIGAPQRASIDPTATMALIATAIPGQPLMSDSDWGQASSDHVFEFGTDLAQPSTTVRILHGVYPPPPPTRKASWALYDDAAAFWVFGAGGLAIRVATSNPLPESLTRLEALAHDLVNLDAESSSETLASDPVTEANPNTIDATTTAVPPPPDPARNAAWDDGIDNVVADAGLILAGSEYAPADVDPFWGVGIANVGQGRIEFEARAFGAGEFHDDQSWQQQVAGSEQTGISVPEGTLFLDDVPAEQPTDEPASSARRAVVVAPTGVVRITAEEVAEADLPSVEVFEHAARQLAAALPMILSAKERDTGR